MKNTLDDPIEDRSPVKFPESQTGRKTQTCPVCPKSYKRLERHMKNAHRPDPPFAKRMSFLAKDLQHIFTVLIAFIGLYLLPFPDFIQSALYYIMQVFFFLVYPLYLLVRSRKETGEKVSSLNYPFMLSIYAYMALIAYLDIFYTTSSRLAEILQGAFLALRGKQTFTVPPPELSLLFFSVPVFWVAGCLYWEIILYRKKIRSR